MPLNLELKARIASLARARETARRAGAAEHGAMVQIDTYFRSENGRLKLREIDGKEAELIAYERPEAESARWSRYEKTPVPDPACLRKMLARALGILVTVRKRRELFILEESRIHLDLVEGLGQFLEFEVPVHDEPQARGMMARLRALFGVTEADTFLHSYSDILLEAEAGAKPAPEPDGPGRV